MNISNYNVIVKRSKAGLGLFALQLIPSGVQVIEYKGPIITKEEAYKKGGKYLFRIDKDHSVDGSPRTNTARYINHSCQPNAEAFISDKQIWIWSTETIQAGEEITINYGQEYFDKQIKPKGCKCKTCITELISTQNEHQ